MHSRHDQLHEQVREDPPRGRMGSAWRASRVPCPRALTSDLPLPVGSRTGAPTVGSGGSSSHFRAGPQSGSPGHVSSPRLFKRSMRISRTTLPCLLRVKGYVADPAGSAFPAAGGHRTRR